jgi:hypothetical protein
LGVAPDPLRPHEAILAELEGFYRALSGHVVTFISSLGGWEAMSQAQHGRLLTDVEGLVPRCAVDRYGELSRRLAHDCREFAIWVDMSDHQATRTQLRHAWRVWESCLSPPRPGVFPISAARC